MTDRESIVAYLNAEAKTFAECATSEAGKSQTEIAARLRGKASLLREVADQIERGEDLEPVKPKPTIADLLALHDLDLDALAHKVGVTGEDITTEHVEMLCDGFTADMGALTVLVRGAIMGPGDGHIGAVKLLLALPCAAANDSPLASESARNVAALGAKVRAALATPTIKVATPRILQSADESPCGSLLRDADGFVTVRLVDGTGWQLCMPSETPLGVDQEADSTGWEWDRSCVRGPIAVLAEGLTEAECRHLSGLSADDAIAWCKAREEGRRG